MPKLLVISLAGVGDTLCATALIHELRLNFPAATIDALVRWRGAADILEGNPHLNRVFQRDLMAESKATALRFLWGLRHENYDTSLNTHPQSRLHYRVVARLIGAHTRISHSYHGSPLIDRLCVNRLSPQDYSRHAIENNLALLQLCGGSTQLSSHGYEIFLRETETSWARDFIAQTGLGARAVLGVHVGSGGTKNLALRRWPLENYAELIRQVIRHCPQSSVLLLGGPEEEEDHDKIKKVVDASRVFFPATKNLRQAAALIKHCRAFLSVDTALMHLAAAMRVPGQIVIETPTWNKPIQPYGNGFTLVKNPAIAGRNLDWYRYDGGGIRGTVEEIVSCMRSVSVDAVLAVVMEVMK